MSPDILPAVAAGAGAVLGSMYLDARYLLSGDLYQLKAGAAGLINFRIWQYQKRHHLYYRFKEQAKAHPDKIMVVFEGKPYTYRKIEQDSNRLAYWLLANDVKKKDVVCMMLQNHPTFYIALFAISKIGAVPALINNNLSDASLWHCVKITGSSLFLFDPMYEKQVETVAGDCRTSNITLVAYGEATEDHELPSLPIATTLTPGLLKPYSTKDLSEKYLDANENEAAFLIYTSGTTGMPKAAPIQHSRADIGMVTFGKTVGITSTDRVYCVLPLYHSSGIIIATLVAMYAGATIVLGRKFSASRFWTDCVQYNVTACAYIGEFCRYLLTQSEVPEERKHKVRLFYGNGMRPDVWDKFKQRYNIPLVCEFYAATEAPVAIFNRNTGEIGTGAVGRRGKFYKVFRDDIQLIRIDPITEEPVRGPDGFCIKAGVNEPGELLVQIKEDAALQFGGYYKNKEATNKKKLRNVLEKGDVYFRSGDLLKQDEHGFYYFGDRVGDTFRWKSENVATTEVAQVLGMYPGVQEANVYGVLVPGHDGRAGMAAIVANQEIDLRDLYRYLLKKLPRYAVPIFIRFVPAMEITGTFKQQKVLFREQGIDLNKVTEPVYWVKGETYVPFTREDYAIIEQGKAKL